MMQFDTNDQLELLTSKKSSTVYNNDKNDLILHKWSNFTFYDTNLNKTIIHVPNTNFSGMYHFTVTAERLMKNNLQNNSYTMIVFDINLLSDIKDAYDHAIFNALIHHVLTTLQTNILKPNLFCRINDDNFAIFVENYKAIDIALFVINLKEEISSYNPELTIKLTFGICPVDNPKIDIPSLCKLAFYAKSTLIGQSVRFLANYDELVFQKKMPRS
ncbi:MAG: GGDEF domain-containing protein [Mobilitalea sp.]